MMFEIRNILFPFPILDNNTKIDKTYIFVSDTIQCYLYNYELWNTNLSVSADHFTV